MTQKPQKAFLSKFLVRLPTFLTFAWLPHMLLHFCQKPFSQTRYSCKYFNYNVWQEVHTYTAAKENLKSCINRGTER